MFTGKGDIKNFAPMNDKISNSTCIFQRQFSSGLLGSLQKKYAGFLSGKRLVGPIVQF